MTLPIATAPAPIFGLNLLLDCHCSTISNPLYMSIDICNYHLFDDTTLRFPLSAMFS